MAKCNIKVVRSKVRSEDCRWEVDCTGVTPEVLRQVRRRYSPPGTDPCVYHTHTDTHRGHTHISILYTQCTYTHTHTHTHTHTCWTRHTFTAQFPPPQLLLCFTQILSSTQTHEHTHTRTHITHTSHTTHTRTHTHITHTSHIHTRARSWRASTSS